VRRSTLRAAIAVVTAGLTLTACGSDDGASGGDGGGSDAATATSAEDLGGMDALIKAAQ
jgi:putative spermidine/putrescine transport system substrate-binding protein